MKSRRCILETIKPLNIILDSAMASKTKNIDQKKSSPFYPEDGFHPKKIHGVSEEPNPLHDLLISYGRVKWGIAHACILPSGGYSLVLRQIC